MQGDEHLDTSETESMMALALSLEQSRTQYREGKSKQRLSST